MAIDDLATVNAVLGPNGAGKTSVFEAIFTLAHGRSFRRFGGKRDALVSLNAEQLLVYGEAVGALSRQQRPLGAPSVDEASAADIVTHKIGLSKSRLGETRIRRNGVAVKRLSEITEQLPVIAINADTFDLLSGPPQERRSFLDWSVFHVEHSYKDEVRAFARALAQRNALLRSLAREGGAGHQGADQGFTKAARVLRATKTAESELAIWTKALAAAGEQLDLRRREIFGLLNQEFKKLLPAVGLESFSLSLSYRRGWDSKLGLADALRDSESVDVVRGFTSVGPHRCDVQIAIEIDGQRRLARDVMSRGQLKLTIFALKLSQLSLLQRFMSAEYRVNDDEGMAGATGARRSGRCLLLLDDIAAELDPGKLQSLGAIISGIDGVQVFVNGTTEALLLPFITPFESRALPIKKFHVEHGSLR